MFSYFSHVRKGIEQHKLGENKRVSRKVNRQTNKRTNEQTNKRTNEQKNCFRFSLSRERKMVFAVCPYFDMFFAKVGLQLLNLSNSFILSQSRKQQ